MKANYFHNFSAPRSLNAQIQAAQNQLAKDQQRVKIHYTAVTDTITQQITRPSSLLLAMGIGFVIGELTWKPKRIKSVKNPTGTAENTPLMTTVKLLISIHTLYKTLPLNWLKKAIQDRGRSKCGQQPPVQRTN